MINKINLKIIIIFILLFLIIYQTDKKYESFENSDKINKLINQEYQADYEAINNLSEISYQLLKDGMIVPSDVIINGNFKLPKEGTIYKRLDDNSLKKINLNDIVINNNELFIKTNHGFLRTKKDSKNKYYTSLDNKIKNKKLLNEASRYNIKKVNNLEDIQAPSSGC